MTGVVLQAIAFAEERHGDQKYAGQPYRYHLNKVADALAMLGHFGENWACAAWLHDVLEDTPTTVEEVRERFGDWVAEAVWSVTGVGRNRKERNLDIYAKIALFPDAATLKLADRYANVEASLRDPATGEINDGMALMYLKERGKFEEAIQPYVSEENWATFDALMDRVMAEMKVFKFARRMYEDARKSVAGRPAWENLNPSDPYDMGMRSTALREARTALTPAPVEG